MLLGLGEVFYAYTIKRHNLENYYFIADSKLLQLVMNLPDTSKNNLKAMYCCSALRVVQRIPCSKSFDKSRS